MTKINLLFLLSFPWISWSQSLSGSGGYLRSLRADIFQSCEEVKNRAQTLSAEIADRVHVIALYPDQRTLFMPFPSDNHAQAAASWISNHNQRNSPFGLFYFVNGSYKFRCRDAHDRLTEVSGPSGDDPLALKASGINTSIWHFFLTPKGVAHVFVLTSEPLRDLRGEELLAQVGTLLQARFVFLYARNDPWFLDYAPDSLPYIFAASFRRISEDEYRASETLVCSTDHGCRLGAGPF